MYFYRMLQYLKCWYFFSSPRTYILQDQSLTSVEQNLFVIRCCSVERNLSVEQNPFEQKLFVMSSTHSLLTLEAEAGLPSQCSR